MTVQPSAAQIAPGVADGWWARLHTRYGLLADAGAFVASTVATSGFGFIFWVVAARLYPPSAVGLGSAAISMMYLIGNISRVGLDITLARTLPSTRDGQQRRALVSAGLLVVFAIAILTSAVFLVQHLLALQVTAALDGTPWRACLFVATCGGWGVGLVLDQVLLVNRQGQVMVWKNATISSTRLVLLPAMLLVVGGSFGIVAATTLGVAAGLGVVWYLAGKGTMPPWSAIRHGAHELRSSLAGYALGSYFSALVAGLPTWLLPLIIVKQAGTSDAAYFYASWMIATVMNTVPSALATGFFMEGARRRAASHQLLRNVYGQTLACAVVAALILMPSAHWILDIFKPAYAAHATTLLRYLALANVPSALLQVYFMQLQLECRLLRLGLQNAFLTAVALLGSYLLLPPLGLSGVGIAYCAACFCAAIFILTCARNGTTARCEARR
jgi:O-antigen/teichoic acid export membrane protein